MSYYFVGLLFFVTHYLMLGSLADDRDTKDEVGLTTAEIIRLRGFHAEDHYFISGAGYVLNIVRAFNQQIPQELRLHEQLAFFHGTLTSANSFLVNSVGARPQDLTGRYSANMTDSELESLIGPTSKSLPFTAMNLGFVVWLVNMRGTRASLANIHPDRQPFFDGSPRPSVRSLTDYLNPFTAATAIGDALYELISPITEAIGIRPEIFENSTSFIPNTKYWDFSMDDQAYEDMPATFDYVLTFSNTSRLALVAHSSGGALVLMSLAVNPDLNHKASKIILWAPSLDLGPDYDENLLTLPTAAIDGLFVKYVGPFLPPPIASSLKQTLAILCQTALTEESLCNLGDATLFGKGGLQQNLSPGIITVFFDLVSSHHLESLIQSVKKGYMHHFDYYDDEKNIQHYGQLKPPIYDLSNITSKNIVIFYAYEDILVVPKSIERTINRLNGEFSHVESNS